MRETALKNQHIALGARMVPFAGWTMPVQYAGILEEVRMVRSAAGLFDLGHMGRVRVRGSDAEAFLQKLQTNDAARIEPGRIRYALILDDQGMVQDDILLYREPDGGGFFMVVNAANSEKDLAIMQATAEAVGDVRIEDQTEALGMIAIQGPAAQEITQKLCSEDLSSLRYYGWTNAEIAGLPMEISRTGYTGEDGFEVYVPADHAAAVWQAFLEAGEAHGLGAVGLGARDVLRLEAGMALYGHEIDASTNPLEAGLGWAVKFTHDFTGRDALEAIEAKGGTGRRLVGLLSSSRRVPRQGYPLLVEGQEVGFVCSGAASPTLGTHIATGYVADPHTAPGTSLTFAVRERREPAEVAELPFYKRQR